MHIRLTSAVIMRFARRTFFLVLPIFLALEFVHAEPAAPAIHTDDVALFYRVYDAAGGAPTAAVLQRDYLDAGSDALRQFIPNRIVSSEKLAQSIREKPSAYERARACMAALPDVRDRVSRALVRLNSLLPEARSAPVTLLVGRATTGGTTGAAGVLIGIETVCGADWMQSNLEDRLVYLIAHEYAHLQQRAAHPDISPLDGSHTVLQVSLIEGGADFLAELIAGSASNSHLQLWLKGREAETAQNFLRAAASNDVRSWVYNGPGTAQAPGDLGYWAGYRIAKCYYERAADQKRAVQELVALENPQAILDQSGWPGGSGSNGCSP